MAGGAVHRPPDAGRYVIKNTGDYFQFHARDRSRMCLCSMFFLQTKIFLGAESSRTVCLPLAKGEGMLLVTFYVAYTIFSEGFINYYGNIVSSRRAFVTFVPSCAIVHGLV